MRKLFLLLSLTGLMLNSWAGAKLSASTRLLDFDSSKRIQYLDITNTGDQKAFVKLSASRIIDPGLKTVNTRLASTKELLLTPKKIILKPGQTRKVKVLRRIKKGTSDAFFRIYAQPVPMPKKGLKSETKTVGLEVQVGIGTNTFVIVRPKRLTPNIQMKKTGGQLVLTNLGNTTVKLHQVKQCADKADCKLYPNYVLYPGVIKKVGLKTAALPVSLFEKSPGVNQQRMVG